MDKSHVLILSVTSFFTMAQIAHSQTVTVPTKFDISPPLRSIPQPPKTRGIFLREHIVRPIPFPPENRAFLRDLALQNFTSAVLEIGPPRSVPGIGIGGVEYTIGSDPPDTNGSVSKTHYVEWVNTGLAIFDKASGHLVLGPIDGNVIWTGFGGNCEHYNDGDPIVLYDKQKDRWLLTQFAVSGTPFSQCVAVSTSSDPTGSYARYEYQFQDFNDYPKFGVWPDAYYGTFNMFHGNVFAGAKACAFERDKMALGHSARMVCYDVPGEGGMLPADMDGQVLPPAGAPNYMLNLGSSALNLWKFHINWGDPIESTFNGPLAINTSPFEVACRNAANPGQCAVQPRTSQTLDTLSDRLMYRLAYRKFVDHESLLVNHAVLAGSTVGVRWYELRDPGGTPKIYQQGTYSPDGAYRWMASLAMDKTGNILMGYTVSSPTMFPGIALTGRSWSDPLGQMAVEKKTISGTGSQLSPDRWGDYASMSVDPVDDCTFWFSTQYASSTGQFDWSTNIESVRFNNCR